MIHRTAQHEDHPTSQRCDVNHGLSVCLPLLNALAALQTM
jgi:hypothetical protein